ncbi:hypothetical protein RMR16_024910 (plasmid) [Agrobacterium sp. rho-13.3]|uniref:hypothetical protein n=1 Tax=Agrobacterium sp. rho-13.3 TaxID=3072980 RepID=UPI002A170B95|nr:hypothetical protein [Agrobacterium sp. rho-13.3]MDX8310194.1 hypothetical protein [Agrobacterium sp. rho-13.3]
MDTERFINTLEETWAVEKRKGQQNTPSILGYSLFNIADLPEKYLEFLSVCQKVQSPSDNAWFLMLEDFARETDTCFRWNEFEMLSQEAALDLRDSERIRMFWNQHLPILMSVKDGYSFIALKISKDFDYHIVVGREPDFEDTYDLCHSIENFFSIFSGHIKGQDINPLLEPMI